MVGLIRGLTPPARRSLAALLLFVLAGCSARGVDLDSWICSKADLSIDTIPTLKSDETKTTTHITACRFGDPKPANQDASIAAISFETGSEANQQPETKSAADRLQLPAEIPGGNTPDLRLPPPTAPAEEREKAITKNFPPLPPLAAIPPAALGPSDQPLSLEELQKIGLTNSPVLRQAVAEMEAARGAMVQASLYPNPTMGYIQQTVGPGGGPYYGGFVGQLVKTPGKMKFATRAAQLDLQLYEYRLRQAQVDLQAHIRNGYFAVLVARENLRVTQAMARLTDEIFKVMVQQLRGGEVAMYEPMQVRVLALQARTLTIQAHNRYLASWKHLASAMGVPGMPLTELEGRADMPYPRYRYDEVLARVLRDHTEVLAADKTVDRAESLLRVAKLSAYPDADAQVSILQDDSAPGPAKTVAWVQVGMAVPVWDRKQGSIYQARANVAHARQEAARVRSDLTSRLADAFERYENNRSLAELYSKEMLPNQVQAFRAAVARHFAGEKGGTSYNDVINAEQNLVSFTKNYLSTLRDLWSSVVDVAALLQTSDLFQTTECERLAPIPDLSQLMNVGEAARCSPIQNPALRVPDGVWLPGQPK